MSAVFQGLDRDRFDAKLKVTGRAMYAGDHDLPNLAFGYLIQSGLSAAATGPSIWAPLRKVRE